jgi:hypothetical protein
MAAKAARSEVEKGSSAVAGASLVLEEARRAGLLDGERTEHVSFRAPKALIDAAMRRCGRAG